MFMGCSVDVRAADTWALGCLFYELLTGAVLFPGQGDCLRPILTVGSGCCAWCTCVCVCVCVCTCVRVCVCVCVCVLACLCCPLWGCSVDPPRRL